MALVKEDGTIVANADTYADVTDLDTYVSEYNVTLTASTTAEKEALLRQAMDYLDRYIERWKGSRVSETQSLPWPRTDVWLDGMLLPSDEIPRLLQYAQLSLAVTADTTELLPVTGVTTQGPVIEERVEGAVTVKYANPGKVQQVPSDAAADTMIRPLLKHGGLLSAIRV